MLTEQNRKQYEAEGYTLVRGLIEPEALAAVRKTMAALEQDYQGFAPEKHFQVLDPEKFKNPAGDPMPWGVQLPAAAKPEFARVADHPNLQQAMADLLGGPVKRFTDQAIAKWHWLGSEQGGKSFYHQDAYYWRLEPKAGCNAWMPLDPVGPGAIALGIIPGVQDWQLLDHEQYFDEPAMCSYLDRKPLPRLRIPAGQYDDSNEIVFEMEPGDALFFTNFTLHRSEPNRTDASKFFYAVAYQLENARRMK